MKLYVLNQNKQVVDIENICIIFVCTTVHIKKYREKNPSVSNILNELFYAQWSKNNKKYERKFSSSQFFYQFLSYMRKVLFDCKNYERNFSINFILIIFSINLSHLRCNHSNFKQLEWLCLEKYSQRKKNCL